MLEALCAKRVTGVFASHLHMLHSLPLDATGVALWRMEVADASWGEAGRYPLQRECAHAYPSSLQTATSTGSPLRRSRTEAAAHVVMPARHAVHATPCTHAMQCRLVGI